MNKSKYIFMVFVVLTYGICSTDASASRRYKSLVVAQNGRVMSAEQAMRQAEDKFGGKALSAKLEQYDHDNSVYRVKMINGGRVKTVTIPAN